MADRSASAQSLLAQARHLARYMLSGRPDEADQLLARVDLPADPASSRYVLAFADSGYVVVDHGTYTTEPELPTWATSADVHEVDVPARGETAVWERMHESAEALRSLDAELYDHLRVGDTIDAISIYYHPELDPSVAALIGGMADLAPVTLEALDDLLGEPEIARGWALDGLERVKSRFIMLQLAIHPASTALATLTLMARLSDPRVPLAAGLMKAVRPGLELDELSAIVQRPDEVKVAIAGFPVPNARLGVVADAGFYALYFEHAGQGGIRIAWEVARALERDADESLDAARKSTSIELFYGGLTAALLQYSAADSIYAFIDAFFDFMGHAAPETFPEIAASRVLCEERRVTVLGSLWHATGMDPAKVDPTSFASIGAWINELAGVPYEQAVATVHDHVLRLVIPSFMRDLTLGSVARLTGRAETARASLARAFEALDRDLERNSQLPTEPNYLVPVGNELAMLYDSLGEPEAAARMRRAVAGIGGR